MLIVLTVSESGSKPLCESGSKRLPQCVGGDPGTNVVFYCDARHSALKDVFCFV